MDDLFVSAENISADYGKLTDIWNKTMLQSFDKVRKSSNRKSGIDSEVKELVKEERKVKKGWSNGAEKDQKLTEIREEVSCKIASNLEKVADEKLQKIAQSACPQAEVFKIRRKTK